MTTHILKDDKGICGEPANGWNKDVHSFSNDAKNATCGDCVGMIKEERVNVLGLMMGAK